MWSSREVDQGKEIFGFHAVFYDLENRKGDDRV